MPSEFAVAEVYFPPLLVALVLGVVAAIYTSRWLNCRRLSRYFVYPSLVFLSMVAIYTIIIGTVIIGM